MSEPSNSVTTDSPFETLDVEVSERIQWVRLNRPEVINALSSTVLSELTDVFEKAGESGAKALILIGTGRGFSSGADLSSLATDVDLSDWDSVVGYMARWRRAIVAIRTCPIPTVSAIHGPAYGGGLNLALACDIVVAAEDARMCQSYIDRAVSTDLGGSYLFPRLVGWAQARRFLLTGEVFDGAMAERMGLASSVVPEASIAEEAERLALLLADKDSVAIAAMRKLLDAGESGTLVEALDLEGEAVAAILTSDVFQARLKVFLDRPR